MRVFQLRQIPLGQVWASLLTKIPWDIQSVQKAECRLQTKYKMQTEKKNSFLFFLTDMITYVLSRNRRSKAIFHANSGNLFLFLKWAKNIMYIQVEIPMSLQVIQLG